MAQVNFNVTAGQVEKITDYLNYQTEIDGSPNPETRKVFLYGKVSEYLKTCYISEKSKDGEVARLAAIEEAKTELESLEIKE